MTTTIASQAAAVSPPSELKSGESASTAETHAINTILANHDALRTTLSSIDKLFVVGCGKSGTTWLMNVLNGHPNVVVRGEGSFAWRLAPMVQQALNAFNTHMDIGQPAFIRSQGEDFLLMMRMLCDSFFARYLQQAGADPETVSIVGDKTPQHSISMGFLQMLYPTARFVHIYRDPRDVATSAWFHEGRDDPKRGFEQFIEHYMNEVWPLAVRTARNDGMRMGPSQYFEIRYEDLLVKEDEILGHLCRFLGVEDSDDAINACSESGSFRKLSGGRQRGESDNSNFYRKGVAGDWKNHLPADLVQRLCAPIADLMSTCGYDPS